MEQKLSFINELKRRNVFRVGVAYVVAAWLLLQLTEVLTELLEIGPEVGKIVIVLLIVGFFPAVFFAWAFELTPEGIKRESEIDRSASIAPQTGRKLNHAIVAMLVLVAAYFFWESRYKEVEQEAGETAQVIPATAPEQAEAEPAPANTQKSIVVLPFLNMSNDPDQEFFSDGLSEEILNALVKVPDLRVISRTSAFAFKGKDVSIPDIAAQLDVSHVLEGSVRKAGNDVRITAQLIEVDSDSHLWSEAYNRSLENIFEIQEEISRAIANELQVTLSNTGDAGRPTDDINVYQAFLRGRHHYQDRGEENLDRAMEILRGVVADEPGYAEAWATLAGASVVRSFQVDEGSLDLVEQGRHAANKAIEADPNTGFAYAVRGLLNIRELNWEAAMADLDKAIELNPNESNSLLWKGIGLLILGYNEEARGYLLQAEKVDPVFALLQSWIVGAYTNLGDAEAVKRHAAKEAEFTGERTNNEGRYSWHLMQGDIEAAEEAWAAADMLSLDTDLFVRAAFRALRDPTQKDVVTDLLLENEGSASSQTLFPYLWLIGSTQEALDHMGRVLDSGRGLRVSLASIDIWAAYNRSRLGALGLPAFFERIGLADYWRKHGDPDLCRVSADTIECDES
jgi:TolB-like protein